MDAKQYLEMKANGGVTIFRMTENNARIVAKQFNPANGEPSAPLMEDYDLIGLRAQRDALQKQMEGLDAFIKDLEASEILIK